MLRALFARLTSRERHGEALFQTLVATAREPHWYVEGEVPDSIDGRFAMLATVSALAIVRLDRGGEGARKESVGLTERFIDAMDSEHRQLGLGDPALGKTVRQLVGALGRRVEIFRTEPSPDEWSAAVKRSIYRGGEPNHGAIRHTADELDKFARSLAASTDEALIEGKIG